jgi:hypothetical protein
VWAWVKLDYPVKSGLDLSGPKVVGRYPLEVPFHPFEPSHRASIAESSHNSQTARLDRDSQKDEKNPLAEPLAGSIRRTERFEKRGLQDLPTIPQRFGCDGRCRIWGSPSFRILCVSWLLALIFRNE